MTSLRNAVMCSMLSLSSIALADIAPPKITVVKPTTPAGETQEAKLKRVAAAHGAAGPWAVAGFRMGEFVARKWQVAVPGYDIEVEHRSPAQVQYSCVLDGAAAATGASIGKLSAKFTEVPITIMDTTFRHKPTGRVLILRLTEAFKKRFTDSPREKAQEMGATVMSLPDAEIFEVASAAERK